MILVIIESPDSGNVDENLRYLRACMADCLNRGEAPFASHGLYTQPGVLRDGDPDERKRGIEAGFTWRKAAAKTVVYTDFGITSGMQWGIDDADRLVRAQLFDTNGHRIEYRQLGCGCGAYEGVPWA